MRNFTIFVEGKGFISEYFNGTISYEANSASILSFTIMQESEYFNKLEEFLDKIKVLDIEGTEIFTGRVLSVKKSMNSDGEFINEVTCESVLNYLVDVTVPSWNFYGGEIPKNAPKDSVANVSVEMLLENILDVYNEGSLTKINLGNITVKGFITVKTNRQTCLQVIMQELIKPFGGFIMIRKEKDQYFLDYLEDLPLVSGENNFNVGINIQSIEVTGSLSSICTRIIGIGPNNKLEATAVNESLVKKYGIMDKVIQYKVETLEELQSLVDKDIQSINDNILNANVGALDLSYIDNNFTALKLYQTVTVTCSELGYNKEHYIEGITLNLSTPYSSSFNINKNIANQTDQITEIIQSNNENNLEILELNGQLEEKVSNGEFETYKLQTAEEINQKVSNGQLTSSMTEFMNEFDFTIGNDTPLIIKKNDLEMSFTNGTTLNITEDGFVWNQGGKNYNYKSIVETGSVSNIESGQNTTIQLPQEFTYKNGDYQFIWWTGNVELPNSSSVLYSADCILVDSNMDEAWFEIRADVMYSNKTNDSAPTWGGNLNVMWMAIG
ncbi:MAG: hypothetical protein ACRDDY_13350 [Clostridium sp.]|uniref:hypothetical protein n=1 Tax=Clostridium sp. TaxID=1506 RepID=UPI003EE6743E